MKSASFDWYQATIPAQSDEVISWFRQVWPDAIIRPAKPKNGASECVQVALGEMVVCSAIWGGGMEGHGVNVWSSGVDAIFFADQLRRRFPVHRVTRADVAIDFEGEGAWEWASAKGFALADRHRLKVDHQGDFYRGARGRTLYFGSRQSPVRLVIYEKGKQIPELGMPHLVRMELRVMPKDAVSGRTVSMLEPMALYGCAAWSKELGEYLTSQDEFKRVVIGTRWTKSDRERAVNALVKQYGGILGEICGELGSWADVGEELGRRITEAAEAKNRLINDARRVARGLSIVPEGVRASEGKKERAGA